MNFLGFPIKMATPTQIMLAMARAKRIYADENIVVAQDRDGTIYIDENRAKADLPKSPEST
jgi:hypothetical protein